MSIENTLESLIVDAESDVRLTIPDLYVHSFDRQGHVSWDKELFAKNIYQPLQSDGSKVWLDECKGKRPLNGHFALWLATHHDQIPEEWKPWIMVFMGTVISHVSWHDMGTDPELTCPKLWFEDGIWKAKAMNFSSYPLVPNMRIPLLPDSRI